ncbi:UDP-3-O-(3-hydroxymyristoyl)glucosamine N-acyltransferase [Alphaproteobacteria bacterium]|jgi:UDP-3-O-[3-hydroxymyristoyl] glucosamine N-acyltransferase|nr:UDP-3-O-(3-hydroxymyristoyl)glucosamine N-acyltransferase [Alphaproteobacteria bacterium]
MSINTVFYQITKGVTAADLAKIIGATYLCGPDQIVISDIESFDAAKPFSLLYQSDPDLVKTLAVESAVVITNEACLPFIDRANCCLVVASPRIGFAYALAHLVTAAPVDHGTAGIAPIANIADTAVIHPSATIMPQVVVGAGTVIEAGAVLHAGVTVGENCHIRSNSVLSYCLIGNAVDIGAGSILGAAGFGFEMTDDGVVKLPHIGLVVIDDFATIGSGCAIDRGSLGNTHIGAHVMMDNLCHIAHNVTIGARSIIAGQCGISGSVTVGQGVAMGGQVGIAPHLKIGDGAVLTARSGVTKDIEDGDQVAGFPAMSKRQFWREQAALRRLGTTKASQS